MLGRDPNGAVCVAEAPQCFDVFINTVWAPSFHSADVVAVWMCSAVAGPVTKSSNLSSFPATPATGTVPRGASSAFAFAFPPRRLPSPQKPCQDNGGGEGVSYGSAPAAKTQSNSQARSLQRAHSRRTPAEEVPPPSFKDLCCHSICLLSAYVQSLSRGGVAPSRRTLNSARV